MNSANTPDGSVAVLEPRAADTPSRQWYAALDGWRGVAVLAVVAFHADVLDGGWLGVDLFFVLSGFLITRVVLAGHAQAGRVQLGEFWRRRFRRLLPALLVVMVAVGGIAALWPAPERLPSTLPAEAVATLAYGANWFALFASGGYWDQYAVASPLRHMWSLAIEEQFYVVFPLVVVAALAWRRRALGWVLALATLASWTAALVMLASGTDFERVYLGTDTRLGAITLGAFVGYLTTRPGWFERLRRWAVPLAPVAALAIAALVLFLDGNVVWSAQRWVLVLGFELAVVVVLVAATSPGGWLNRALAVRALVFFGAISYGLYLWHIPVQFVVQGAAPDLQPVVLLALVLVISTLVAWVSWRFLETPLRREGIAAFRRRGLPPRTTAAFLAGAAGLGAVALIGVGVLPAQQANRSGEELMSIAPPTPGGRNPSLPVAPASPLPEQAGGVSAGDGGLPVMLPEGRPPRVLLIGDSLAYDLAAWLIPNQASLGVVANAATRVGCGVGGLAPDDSLLGPEQVVLCEQWQRELPEVARRAEPDVIVLTRFTSREPDAGVSRCDPAYGGWFRSTLERDVEELAAASGVPVVVTTIPYNRAFGVGERFDDIVDCLNVQLRAAAERSGFPVVDLAGWVCPTRACRLEEDGVELRPDGLHFQRQGAGVALRWLFDQVMGPTGRSP